MTGIYLFTFTDIFVHVCDVCASFCWFLENEFSWTEHSAYWCFLSVSSFCSKYNSWPLQLSSLGSKFVYAVRCGKVSRLNSPATWSKKPVFF